MLSYLTQNRKHHLCEDTLKNSRNTFFSEEDIQLYGNPSDDF